MLGGGWEAEVATRRRLGEGGYGRAGKESGRGWEKAGRSLGFWEELGEGWEGGWEGGWRADSTGDLVACPDGNLALPWR